MHSIVRNETMDVFNFRVLKKLIAFGSYYTDMSEIILQQIPRVKLFV